MAFGGRRLSPNRPFGFRDTPILLLKIPHICRVIVAKSQFLQGMIGHYDWVTICDREEQGGLPV